MSGVGGVWAGAVAPDPAVGASGGDTWGKDERLTLWSGAPAAVTWFDGESG